MRLDSVLRSLVARPERARDDRGRRRGRGRARSRARSRTRTRRRPRDADEDVARMENTHCTWRATDRPTDAHAHATASSRVITRRSAGLHYVM